MQLNATARYALKAVLYLAKEGDSGAPVPMVQIASATRVPRNYLSKVLHRLAQEGVLNSSRGPGGGFSLAISPDALSLATIITPFGPDGRGAVCLLREGPCDLAAPCIAHHQWTGIARQMADFFETMTIAQLLTAG